MELQLTGIYKNNQNSIIGYGWKNEVSRHTGKSIISNFVEWIERKGGKVYIKINSRDKIYCSVRVLPNGERIIQPSKSGMWSDDLNSLRSYAV